MIYFFINLLFLPRNCISYYPSYLESFLTRNMMKSFQIKNKIIIKNATDTNWILQLRTFIMHKTSNFTSHRSRTSNKQSIPNEVLFLNTNLKPRSPLVVYWFIPQCKTTNNNVKAFCG